MDDCKLAKEEAARVQRIVETFEVTISMVPSRGDQSKVAEMKATVPVAEIVEDRGEAAEDGGEGGLEKKSKEYLKQLAKYGAQELMNNFTKQLAASPLAPMADVVGMIDFSDVSQVKIQGEVSSY